jgi:hypothetical protein
MRKVFAILFVICLVCSIAFGETIIVKKVDHTNNKIIEQPDEYRFPQYEKRLNKQEEFVEVESYAEYYTEEQIDKNIAKWQAMKDAIQPLKEVIK